jgi:NAD(P)-dependent dehydrogenase (short-subunit alcohol dehydrogenase family)
MMTEAQTDLTLGLENMVAIVTGAAGDIGRETVKLLVAHGVKVVAEDIRPSIHDLKCPDQVVTVEGDVSEENTAKRAVELAVHSFGTVDILVNNAGKTMNKPLIDMSVAEWDGIMAVNARGTSFMSARPCVSCWSAAVGLS